MHSPITVSRICRWSKQNNVRVKHQSSEKTSNTKRYAKCTTLNQLIKRLASCKWKMHFKVICKRDTKCNEIYLENSLKFLIRVMTLQLNGFYKFLTRVHRIFPLSTFSNWAQHLLKQNTNFRFWTQVHHVVAISETKWFATCACFDEPTVQLQAFFICDTRSTSGIQHFVFFIQKISKCSQKVSVLLVQECRIFSLLPAASR